MAEKYSQAGADELVFYDITASSDQRAVDKQWITKVAQVINIPFTVAGGIRSIAEAEKVLHAGADKISINSPALEDPSLINTLVNAFGQQCIVIGIDSLTVDGDYVVMQYTGDSSKTQTAHRSTRQWLQEVQHRGAGEIVLNCMDQDGVRRGYDIEQLKVMRALCDVPLIASGGAGDAQHFTDVFQQAQVDGALAASIFHKDVINIDDLKYYLRSYRIEVRL